MADGFRVRKWESNESSVLTDVPKSEIGSIVNMPTDTSVRLLGIVWNPEADSFFL